MKIDARNLTCPKPVILTLEALPKLAQGEALEVVINDAVALGNLTRLADEKNCELTTTKDDEDTVMTFTPREAVAASVSAATEASLFCNIPERSATIVAVDAEFMGRGDDELGHILMKGLIYALAHQESVPEIMLFYNGGAHLTCEGSESLEDIKELESRGTKILTCGTCLDFYGIKDKLAVGGVTNLYAIAEIISKQPGVMVL